MCIGQHFGLMEAQLVLSLIAQKVAPRLVPYKPVGITAMGTLHPTEGPYMYLHRRD